MPCDGLMLTIQCLRMQKIFSSRLEEATLEELERATRQLGMSKRQFLEEAIQLRAQAHTREAGGDVWADTLGAWRRSESPQTTIQRARLALRQTFTRHHRAQPGPASKGRDARVRR